MELNAKVYVGTYEKYNNGSLEGAWIDLAEHDKESFFEACKELHGEGEHEFMFQDWECPVESLISECGIDDKLWELMEDDENIIPNILYMEVVGVKYWQPTSWMSISIIAEAEYMHELGKIAFWSYNEEFDSTKLPDSLSVNWDETYEFFLREFDVSNVNGTYYAFSSN